MSNEHIVILGDRTLASRWIGYAKEQYNQQVRPFGPNFSTRMHPRPDIHIRMSTFGGVNKIVIYAVPPLGPTFVGIPYDSLRYGGWGAPYLVEDEFSFENPVTSTGVPYGTTFSELSKPVLIDTSRRLLYHDIRYPNYKSQYPDLKYGTMNWVSMSDQTLVSWDGLNSRHKHAVPNEDDIFHGYSEDTCGNDGLNEGLMFIGQVFTKNSLCEVPQPYPEGIYRIVNTHEDAVQDLNDYDYEEALSKYVYKDGEIIWEDAEGRYVSAAALVTRATESRGRYRELRVVVGDYDMNRGIFAEYLIRYDMTHAELIIETELDTYGNDDVILHTANRSFLLPYTNANPGCFSRDGNKLLLLRDYIFVEDDAYVINTKATQYIIEDTDAAEEAAQNADTPQTTDLYGVSVDGEEVSGSGAGGNEVIWDNRETETAPELRIIENYEELPEYTSLVVVNQGDFLINCEYGHGDTIVYAYIKIDFKEDIKQTLEETGACNTYNLIQHVTGTEHLWFSNAPEKLILVRKEDVTYDTLIDLDNTPDYKYRVTYKTWWIGAITSVDARYGAAQVWIGESDPWWYLRGANDGESEYLITYEPLNNITQHFRNRAYLNSEEINEQVFVETDLAYSYSSVSAKLLFCDQVIDQLDIYEHGAAGFAKTLRETLGHVDAQIVAKSTSPTLVDVLYHTRPVSYTYESVNRIVRYDTLENIIVREEEVSEILEIAEFYNTDDESLLAVQGNYGYIGLV